jgi:hypothetical protein
VDFRSAPKEEPAPAGAPLFDHARLCPLYTSDLPRGSHAQRYTSVYRRS